MVRGSVTEALSADDRIAALFAKKRGISARRCSLFVASARARSASSKRRRQPTTNSQSTQSVRKAEENEPGQASTGTPVADERIVAMFAKQRGISARRCRQLLAYARARSASTKQRKQQETVHPTTPRGQKAEQRETAQQLAREIPKENNDCHQDPPASGPSAAATLEAALDASQLLAHRTIGLPLVALLKQLRQIALATDESGCNDTLRSAQTNVDRAADILQRCALELSSGVAVPSSSCPKEKAASSIRSCEEKAPLPQNSRCLERPPSTVSDHSTAQRAALSGKVRQSPAVDNNSAICAPGAYQLSPETDYSWEQIAKKVDEASLECRIALQKGVEKTLESELGLHLARLRTLARAEAGSTDSGINKSQDGVFGTRKAAIFLRAAEPLQGGDSVYEADSDMPDTFLDRRPGMDFAEHARVGSGFSSGDDVSPWQPGNQVVHSNEKDDKRDARENMFEEEEEEEQQQQEEEEEEEEEQDLHEEEKEADDQERGEENYQERHQQYKQQSEGKMELERNAVQKARQLEEQGQHEQGSEEMQEDELNKLVGKPFEKGLEDHKKVTENSVAGCAAESMCEMHSEEKSVCSGKEEQRTLHAAVELQPKEARHAEVPKEVHENGPVKVEQTVDCESKNTSEGGARVLDWAGPVREVVNVRRRDVLDYSRFDFIDTSDSEG